MFRRILLLCGGALIAISELSVVSRSQVVAHDADAKSAAYKPHKPPKGANALFDGTDLSAWGKRGAPDQPAEWLVAAGELTVKPGTGDIVTREKFGDYQLHVEFQIPLMPDKHSQERGNSGVYQQGLFEVQVLDAYQNETYAKGGCAAIYEFKDPDKNVAKPPLEWQTYDITFRAARFDAAGKMIQHPRISVVWNGVKVHSNVEITCGPTRSSLGGDVTATGPIMLQDHGCPDKFRNVWIKPLTARQVDRLLPASPPPAP